MRRTAGKVTFGGRIGYCPQTAWIQNATLVGFQRDYPTECTNINPIQRDNVIFGQTFDKDRYWDAIDRACLLPDLAVLPDGDLTEVS